MIKRGRGGIGRRAGFRYQWRKSWGFKSLRPHQHLQTVVGAYLGVLSTLVENAAKWVSAVFPDRPAMPRKKKEFWVR